MDGGIEVARAFILPFITEGKTAEADYKTQLQEVIQQNPEEEAALRAGRRGRPGSRQAVLHGRVPNSNLIGRGVGHSKKAAEQAAAKEALRLMGLVD